MVPRLCRLTVPSSKWSLSRSSAWFTWVDFFYRRVTPRCASISASSYEEDRASSASQGTTVTSSRQASITHTSDGHGGVEIPGQTDSRVLDQHSQRQPD